MLNGISYETFDVNNPNHTAPLLGMGNKIWRIFTPLGRLEAPIPLNSSDLKWLGYVKYYFENCPDGCIDFDSFSGKWVPSYQKLRDCVLFCKKNGWLPILNLCSTDETHGWIDLAPTGDKWDWLNRFCYYLATYLRDTYAMDRVDMEPFNEPNEKGAVDDWYSPCSVAMIKGWKEACPSWKAHIFNCDISETEYLDKCLANKDLMAVTDYVGVHLIKQKEEWNYLDEAYEKIKSAGKIMTALEVTPFGIIERYNNFLIKDKNGQVIGEKAEMVATILFIRLAEFGTATEIDDIFLCNGNEVNCTSGYKRDWLTQFNYKYYKPYERDEMLKLEKFYYRLKTTFNRDPKKAGVKFIQDCLGLAPDGKWGDGTDNAVEAYQISKGLVKPDGTADKIVGPLTMKALRADYPDKWDDLEYNVAIGDW